MAPEAPRPQTATDDHRGAKPARVLVVDDSELDGPLVADMIDSMLGGVQTRVVDRAEGVLAAIDDFAPDVVVSDYHMPRYDVLATIRAVRARDPHLPFVVVSGLVGEEAVANLLRTGANDFVPKSAMARVPRVVQHEFAAACVRRDNARLAEALEQERGQLHALSLRLIDAQEEERRRIALELHDDLGGLATLLKMQLAVGQTGQALAGVDRLVQRLRALCQGLRPAELDDFGLGAALRSLAAMHAGVPGAAAIDVVVHGDDARLAPRQRATLYRVAQEALHNALRHAGAARVEIDLRIDAGGGACLVVRDDGCGFEPARTASHLGLAGMRERVELQGGRFDLATAPGAGTAVRAELGAVA